MDNHWSTDTSSKKDKNVQSQKELIQLKNRTVQRPIIQSLGEDNLDVPLKSNDFSPSSIRSVNNFIRPNDSEKNLESTGQAPRGFVAGPTVIDRNPFSGPLSPVATAKYTT